MIERGRVIIIPNEESLPFVDEFRQDIQVNHLEAFQEFNKKYNLGYHFTNDDYQEAPVELARAGHLILKTINDMGLGIFYIPRVVTDKQRNWIRENSFELFPLNKVGGFSVVDGSKENIDILENREETLKVIKEKNIQYRKEVEENVGKKI